MLSIAESLAIAQSVILAIIIIALVIYQPSLPSWAMPLLIIYVLVLLAQVFAFLQGNDRYYFLYSIGMGILLLILYLYYIK